MNFSSIIDGLSANSKVFQSLLTGIKKEDHTWKPGPEKWCLLEVVCHLYDEEREDFRARTEQVLRDPSLPLPSIDPPGWVNQRKYLEQDFETMLNKFIRERNASVKWLQSLREPKWDNAYHHPKFGAMTARMFLCNWLAHDHLHVRQITRLKYERLKVISGEPLQYAGDW